MPAHRFLVRTAVTAFQQLRRYYWFFRRPAVRGVLAVPLTAEGRVVLVRLSYAKGWHLPGGGRKRGEEPEQAVLRELREEIGLTAHSELLRVGEFAHRPDYRRGTTTLFLLRDVRFSPRPSLEIEEIAVFDPAQLPDRVTALTGSKIAEALAESSAR